MNYKVIIERAEFYAYHGCYDLEQMVGNRFEVDVEMVCHLSDPTSDSVEELVSYLTAFNIVEQQMKLTQRTIERVALNIIEALKQHDDKVVSVKCRVSKVAPPLGGKVAKASVEFEM